MSFYKCNIFNIARFDNTGIEFYFWILLLLYLNFEPFLSWRFPSSDMIAKTSQTSWLIHMAILQEDWISASISSGRWCCVCVLCLQAVTGRCNSLHQGELNLWLQSISGPSVIRTFKSWISVWAALMPHWGRVKGVINKCDMLIRGWIEEKIPLSGHEGTPHDSLFRGGCHFNSGMSTDDLANKRKVLCYEVLLFLNPFHDCQTTKLSEWRQFYVEDCCLKAVVSAGDEETSFGLIDTVSGCKICLLLSIWNQLETSFFY